MVPNAENLRRRWEGWIADLSRGKSPIKGTGSMKCYVLSKNFSIKMNFKDQIYLEKTKNPTTQRMGFTSRHLPGIKSTDYKSFS